MKKNQDHVYVVDWYMPKEKEGKNEKKEEIKTSKISKGLEIPYF